MTGTHVEQTDEPYITPLKKYLDQLRDESPRGAVLISTGFLEEQLKQILMAFFVEDANAADLVDGANVPLDSFSSRIAACYALALISRDDLTVLRKIRNEFAHQMAASFDNQSIKDRCANLHHRAKDYIHTENGPVVVAPRGQFLTSAGALIVNLYNRAHHVKQTRRAWAEYPA